MYSVNFHQGFWITIYNLILPICNADTANHTKSIQTVYIVCFSLPILLFILPLSYFPLFLYLLYFWLGILFCPRYFVLHPHTSTLFPILHPISLLLLLHLSLHLHSLSISTLPSHKSSFSLSILFLTGGNWQKWKRVFLTCFCHEIYRDEAVGLKSCKNAWKITIFVKMWNLG